MMEVIMQEFFLYQLLQFHFIAEFAGSKVPEKEKRLHCQLFDLMQPRADFFNSFELPIRVSLTIVPCAHTHKAQHHISRLGKLWRLKNINLIAAKKNSIVVSWSFQIGWDLLG
jgi:hypothetical protein